MSEVCDEIQKLINEGCIYFNKYEYTEAAEHLSKIKLLTKNEIDTTAFINKCLEKETTFPEKKGSIEHLSCESVEKLQIKVKEIREKNKGKQILFRGHSNKNWQLKPTLYRQASKEKAGNIYKTYKNH